VWSTPRNPDAHASSIRKWVDRCKYANRGEE
jgi:hypothetical protein